MFYERIVISTDDFIQWMYTVDKCMMLLIRKVHLGHRFLLLLLFNHVNSSHFPMVQSHLKPHRSEGKGEHSAYYPSIVYKGQLRSHPARKVCQLVILWREGPGLSTPNIIHLVLISGNGFHPSLNKSSADFRWQRAKSLGGPRLLCSQALVFLHTF